MRRHLAAALLVVGALGLAVFLMARSARPRILAHVEGELISRPTGTGPWVAWIESNGQECRLIATRSHRGGSRQVLASRTLSGLAVSGDAAFLTQADGARAELIRVKLPSGTPERLATVQAPAAQMVVGEDWLCWREYREAGLPGVPFVVAGAPINVIRAYRSGGAEARPARSSAASSGADSAAAPLLVTPATGSVELLGIARGDVYWVEHLEEGGVNSTVIRCSPLPQGPPRTLVTEPGRHTAAIGGDALIWAAPSQEAAEPAQFCAVKRRPLAGGDTAVIADWLDPRCSVLVSSRGIYVQDGERLWRLGSQRADQRAIRLRPPALASSSLIGDEQYLVLGSTSQPTIASRPITWWAGIRRAFQL